MKKGQFSFAWLFAIIVGGVVLFLAIYAAVNIGTSQSYRINTEVAKMISIMADPLQASFSEGKVGKVILRDETRLNNFCSDFEFGRNLISASTRRTHGEMFSKIPGSEIPVTNKYIFSSMKNTGREFYIVSKPFYMPFKIADLTIVSSKDYCIIKPPEELVTAFSNMGDNFKINVCKEGDIKVCFGYDGSGAEGCNIRVIGSCEGCDSLYETGVVKKRNELIKFTGNLLYAAIVSDEDIYNCNVKRLFYRAYKLSELLIEKIDLMSARDCNTNLQKDLLFWRDSTKNATLKDLFLLYQEGKKLELKNKGRLCNLW